MLTVPLAIFLIKAATGQAQSDNQPSPSPSPQWSEVAENRTCSNSSCPAGRGFTIDQKGAFRSGRGTTGQLETEDLQRLMNSANAVASQNLSAPIACDSAGAEASVNVTLKKGTTDGAVVIYEGKADGSLCHRGETGRAVALKNELDQLAQKYDNEQPATAPTIPANPCDGKPDGTECRRESTCEPPPPPGKGGYIHIYKCHHGKCELEVQGDCFTPPENGPPSPGPT